MALTFEESAPYLPKYLTEPGKDALRAELHKFPDSLRYYLDRGMDEPLQGDIYKSKHFVLTDGKGQVAVRPTTVMVVSNSCDISTGNKRDFPVSVLVAPLMAIDRYAELLKKSGATDAVVNDKVGSIRRQEVSTMFYLPQGAGVAENSVVLLDAIQAVRRELLGLPSDRLGVLSQAAFYLLLLKLSFHLCRAHEGVDREAA
jgi:hypothetical protein